VKRLLLVVLLAVACRRPAPPPPLPEAAAPAPEVHAALRAPVGVTIRTFEDRTRDRQLVTTIWYPAAAGAVEKEISWDGIFPASSAQDAPLRRAPRRFPLLLLSHGSGGDGSNLAWLAEALASRGWVAAAVDHPGDCFLDSSVEGRFAAWRRPRDLSVALTQLLRDPILGPRIDPRRIVAAGHSSGGSTVLGLAGARLRPSTFLAYCRGPDAGPDCPFFQGTDLSAIRDLRNAGRSHRDHRIRAVVALAPALGRAAITASLRGVTTPVQIIASPTDELVPFHWNAARYARLIPHARLLALPTGGHFVFMPVCNEPGRIIAAQVCVDTAPDLDRAAVHVRVVGLGTAFLDRALGIAASPPHARRTER
jgi:predicted dienelactone hydrolase